MRSDARLRAFRGLFRLAGRAFLPWFTTVSGLLILLPSCSPPPPPIRDIAAELPGLFAKDDGICSFKGYGDIGISMNGERHKAKIDVLWKSDSDFTIGLYSPLGTTLATAKGGPSGIIRVNAGDSAYQKSVDERVDIGGFFDCGLTFSEFLRVATGRLLNASFIRDRIDSIAYADKKAFLYWQEDSTKKRGFRVSAVVDRKHFSITDVIYLQKKPFSWELTQLSFRKGRPKEIRFKDADNYFYVKYETMLIKHGAGCESERM